MNRRGMAAMLAIALAAVACDGGGGGGTGPDLEVERRVGYAVVVDESGEGMQIGFSTDRNAVSGEGFEVGHALWRVEDGPWNEPPVTCLGRGQRVELGISDVQNEASPGLLRERVVWIACLAPSEED